MENTKIVILASGKGTRMQTELPKVLVPLKDSTMIEFLLNNLQNLNSKPVVVVGYGSDLVKEKLGSNVDYAHQDEQLGTGHAVKCAKEVAEEAETIVILYGDMPLVSAETVSNLIESHKNHS